MRRALLAAAALAVVALLLWAPWLSGEVAERRAVAAFERAWSGVDDGCGFNCKGCGAAGAAWVPFGRMGSIEYACGLLPADLPEYHRHKRLFVSAFGTVHGRFGGR